MGDMADVFNDLRKMKQEKRASNTESATAMLVAAGIQFKSFNGCVHLQIIAGNKSVNFWPSTGLWMVAGEQRKSRGVRNLIKYVKSKDQP